MTTPEPSRLPPLRVPSVPGLTGLSIMARGGYATVYQARQVSVGRPVAVKVEHRALASEEDQDRFLREANAAGQMSGHPHVVDLFDVGVTEDGHPYLIMELCAGTYADRMTRAPLAPREVRDIGVKIADALSDAHDMGVLHRDVKPANILQSRFGEPALADFGLAVIAETRDSSLDLDMLTPAYAPPELFRHGTPPSAAADVYALAASLYAMLRGAPPRWRDDNMPSILALVELFKEPIPDLPGVGIELLNILRLGMSNNPENRPHAGAFRDLLADLPITALGVATTSVFAPSPRAGGDESTISWASETQVGEFHD